MASAMKEQDFSTLDVPKPLIVADPTKGVKMNVGVVAQPFRDEIRAKIEAMKKAGLGASEFQRLWNFCCNLAVCAKSRRQLN